MQLNRSIQNPLEVGTGTPPLPSALRHTSVASAQEVLYKKNSHTRLLKLLHGIFLAQYETSAPAQAAQIQHRLMMLSGARLLLSFLFIFWTAPSLCSPTNLFILAPPRNR